MQRTLAIVMAGGSGERLRPLTRDRAKSAVPFGGKFRLIDFPLSNCINSGVRHIFVLSQYKSASLNRHLQEGWGISSAGLGEFIYSMPAQQKTGSDWYGGTADAVRQNLDLIHRANVHRILVLSGDHVYKMDYSLMLNYHTRKKSSLTVSTVNVATNEAAGKLGVFEADSGGRVMGFEEKPQQPRTSFDAPGFCLASMGVYIFNVDVLIEALAGGENDFGKEVIPSVIKKRREIFVYPFEKENRIADCVVRARNNAMVREEKRRGTDSSYWRDVGTIDTYYQASMDLLGEAPAFNLYTESWPLRTHNMPLPPSKCTGGNTCGSIISDGCIVNFASVESSILSPSVIVEKGAQIEDSIIFDRVIVGPRARVKCAIIDKEVIIQPRATLGYDEAADKRNGCFISEGGVVVAPRGAVIRA